MARPTNRRMWIPWLLGWFGLLGIALVNGTVRAVVTQPLLGDDAGRLRPDRGPDLGTVPIWTAVLPAVVRHAQGAQIPVGVR